MIARQQFPTPDPNFAAKVRARFLRQGPLQLLGAELIELKPGFAEIHLPFTSAATQYHGFFHGGIIATMADAASGFASYTVLEPNEECLSVEYKINFLKPGQGPKLIARGEVIKVGRKLIVAQATMSVLRDGKEIDCALMLHTVARVNYLHDEATISAGVVQ